MVRLKDLLLMGLLSVQAVAGPPLAAQDDGVVRLEASDEAMGTSFSLVLHGGNRASLQTAADEAFQEVHRLDRLLSNYRPASEWSAVNRDAASRPVKVSPELFALLS